MHCGYTWGCQSCVTLHPETRPILRRWWLFILRLHSLQKEQLDPGHGAEVPRLAAHCQRSQAWRQFCREENSLQHFPKTLLYSYRFGHLSKHTTTQMFNTAAKNEWKNKLLYLIYKHKLVLPLMAGRCGWGRGGLLLRPWLLSDIMRHAHICSRSWAVSGQTLQTLCFQDGS